MPDRRTLWFMATTKDSRLAMRLTSDQDAVIRRAAEVEGRTITEFSIVATVARAQDVLADQRVFALAPPRSVSSRLRWTGRSATSHD